MDDEDLDFGTTKSRNVKQGRRAKNIPDKVADEPQEEEVSSTPPPSKENGPPGRPAKAMSGWGEETPKSRGRSRQLGEGFEHFEDERLRPRSPEKDDDDSDSEIPAIPELEDQQEEDMTSKVAVAPNVAVNRVATYRELDSDLLRQAAFLTLDNEVDLKLLAKSLSTEADVIEDDRPWDWDRLFTEVTSELLLDMEKEEQPESEHPIGVV
ncbi:intraflagellar transport protein 43 homolog A-like isoform X1 [Gigantopelta aegis]|uniref:intraflagellar transport protein 43 homolog A-like isoform X1 n=1 Tax=Gigantopelta aegis TaxID=1735272 RepID=UPI001B88969E|nr:intraflagellar transport protein 43 homolog A-like isoform X1 [Gigantopelta aegis]